MIEYELNAIKCMIIFLILLAVAVLVGCIFDYILPERIKRKINKFFDNLLK